MTKQFGVQPQSPVYLRVFKHPDDWGEQSAIEFLSLPKTTASQTIMSKWACESKSWATLLTHPLSDGFNSIFVDGGETTEKPVDDFNTKLNHMLLAKSFEGMHDLISISQHLEFSI